ncbi:putative chromatin remodeling & transcriptional activation HMG family [Medicago truncatula]|uniref:Putative chromatin remodeling & transcriptional activation HMG family n=1 Tax=Medicago truncatula TaxID=3880 RepID=A0A396GYL1_MEDTR|nr:uncharacterized protein LOC11409632 [Medicago truncatula]RHN43925.1 putative chromatin remodeling & transcriptional activation HMG family [Medicago truncatula]
MEVKLKEQLEAFKGELLGGLNIVLTQIHQCYPKIAISTLFSIPKTNDVQADARSFVEIKEGKEENTHKKLREKEIQPVDNLAEVKPKKHTQKPRGLCPSGSKPEVLEVQQEKPRIIGNKRKVSWGSMFEVFGDQEKIASSPHLAPKSVDQEEVVDQYIQKSKSKEHQAKKIKVEKDHDMLENPPSSFSLLWDKFGKNFKEVDRNSGVNKMAIKAWNSMNNEDKQHYLDKAAKRKAKHEKLKKKG